MNEPLQLFFQNIDKIRLYFGTEAEAFDKDLALKLTMRNIVFSYDDYEEVVKQIKAHSKWYHAVRSSKRVLHTYYAHFAKNSEQVEHTFHMYKRLTEQFKRGESSYLAALYINKEADIEKIHTLIHEIANRPSLKFSAFQLQTTALLCARPENAMLLSTTYDHYYHALTSIGFLPNDETVKSAVLLTLGSGSFCPSTFQYVKEISNGLRNMATSIRCCHYQTTVLLALTKFENEQFPALYAIHDEICRVLKIGKNECNSLLLAAQIYTSNEAIGDLPMNEFNFSDILTTAVGDGVYSGGDSSD